MSNQKILVTGASGYVGSKIYSELKEKGYNVLGTYNNTKLFKDLIKADLTDKTLTSKLLKKFNPQIIINTAADAHTATCEKDPEYAYKINVMSTKHLADYCVKNEAQIIHISTFACFAENPTNVYPKTKKQAEEIVVKTGNYLILRPSLVVGLSPNTKSDNFYNDLLSAHINNQVLDADVDWEFYMTYLQNLVKVVELIIESGSIKNAMIPIYEKGVTSKYKITQDLGVKAKKISSGRNIPIPKIGESILKKHRIPVEDYSKAIAKMKKELKTLKSTE